MHKDPDSFKTNNYYYISTIRFRCQLFSLLRVMIFTMTKNPEDHEDYRGVSGELAPQGFGTSPPPDRSLRPAAVGEVVVKGLDPEDERKIRAWLAPEAVRSFDIHAAVPPPREAS